MKKILAGLMFIILLAGCAQVQPTNTPAPAPTQYTQTAEVQCEEDMPCWDCETMGNHDCASLPETGVMPEVLPEVAKLYDVVPVSTQEAPETVQDVPAVETAPALTITAQLELEAARFASWEYIPTDEYCTVIYRGTSPHDLTNGVELWSVQSEVDPTVWHTYHVTLTVPPTQAPQPTQEAPEAVVITYTTPQPVTAAPQPVPTVTAAPQRTQEPTPAPQPTQEAPQQEAPQQEAQEDVPAYSPGACKGWQLRMEEWNAAHPDDQLTPADMGRICTGV